MIYYQIQNDITDQVPFSGLKKPWKNKWQENDIKGKNQKCYKSKPGYNDKTAIEVSALKV